MERRAYPQRLATRPGSQPVIGTLNVDLGSSFDHPKSRKRRETSSDSSDDELNSLGARSDTAPSYSAPHTTRPGHDTEDVIKKMKFKKIKNKASTDAESPVPTSKENARRAAGKKPDVGAASTRDRKNAVASSSSTTRPLRDKAPNRDYSPDGAREKHTALPVRQQSSFDGNTVKPARPKPRPYVRPTPTSLTSTQSPSSTPKPTPRSRDVTGGAGLKIKERERQPITVVPPVIDSRRKGGTSKGKEKADFPPISPLCDHKGKGKEMNGFLGLSPLRDASVPRKTGKDRMPKAQSAYPRPSPFSSPAKDSFLPSPLGTPDKKRSGGKRVGNVIPLPSPLTRGQEGKGHKKTRPFPMNSHTPESGSGKRRSIGSDSDDERDRKRYKNQPIVLAESYEEEDSELLFISPNTDPKTLCPYCDTPLPSQPTPLLVRLLDQTYNKSYRDVRPSNPLGRKAPMGVFVAVCQRHRFESQTLPEAEARGWPKSISWAALKGRVLEMKDDLLEILADRGDPVVYGNTDDEKEESQGFENEPKRGKGPRMMCLFWKDLLKDLKKQGTKGVKGVRGQFANFEKTQPGYYGELGSVIIHQTLYDMFPLTSIDPDLVDPLTPNEFIQRILVPEVGMRLVIQDMHLDVEDRSDKKQAVAVLRESASYGVAMFPEDGGDWAGASGKKKSDTDDDVMGVAEQMVMERARKRRKELEIEEREEDEMWRLQQEEAEAVRKREKAEVVKQKRKARRKDNEIEVVIVEQPTTARPRPRPVPKMKSKTVSNTDSANGMDTDSSSDPWPLHPDLDSNKCAATPKPTSRPIDTRAYASDSSEELNTISPLQQSQTKARSSRATSTSSGAERPESSSSLTVSGTKRSTRGSSVLDLCSSSDDDGVPDSRSGSRKAPLQPAVVQRRKPSKPCVLPSSSEDDDAVVTPRAANSQARKGQAPTVSAFRDFRPLEAARRRVPNGKGGRPTGQKRSDWLTSMAEEVCDVDDDEDRSSSQQSSHSWLLDDVSHSQ